MNNEEKFSRLKRPRYLMPDFVREALLVCGLMAAYRERPAYQQNDYIGWIGRAKREATIQKAPVPNARRTGSWRYVHENGLSSQAKERLIMKVGVNVAIIQNEQILLTKRNDFEVWCLPGGHMDDGESVAQAAIREVAEETGLEIRLTRLVGIYSMPNAKAWVNLIISFVGEPIGGVLKAQEDEVLEMAYFRADELPHNLLWGHRQRIMDAFNGHGGSRAWLQNVPFDAVQDRQALYQLHAKSGLSGYEFYSQNFGWDDPEDDKLE